jgi:hypothetical protein
MNTHFAEAHIERRKRLGMYTPQPVIARPGKIRIVNVETEQESPEPITQEQIENGAAPGFALYRNTIPSDAILNMLTPCSWKFLVAFASKRHGILVRDILGTTRNRKVVAARDEAIKLVYQHTQRSLPKTSEIFSRDHTTILHSLRKTDSTFKLVEAPDAPPEHYGPKSRKRKFPSKIIEAVKEGYEKGIPATEIAKTISTTPGSVYSAASRIGIKRSHYRDKEGRSKYNWSAYGNSPQD